MAPPQSVETPITFTAERRSFRGGIGPRSGHHASFYFLLLAKPGLRGQEISSESWRVAVVSKSDTPVVLDDADALGRHFDVRKVTVGSFPASLARYPSLLKNVIKADATVNWFAELPTLVSVILCRVRSRKSVLLLGGFEIANEPNWKYGGRRSLVRKLVTLATLRLSTHVVAASQEHAKNVNQVFPHLKLAIVPNGVDVGFFKPGPPKNPATAITVVFNPPTLRLKGIDRLVAVAGRLPDVQFLVVGTSKHRIEHEFGVAVPVNVQVLPRLTREELLRYYQRTWVVCQLSRHESFGLALAEGMACGCVPVATGVGVAPDLCAGVGFLVSGDDPEETANAIRKALNSKAGDTVRWAVERQFSMRARELCLAQFVLG